MTKREQAKSTLLKLIRDGAYRPGAKLPSERRLAEEMSLSHLTVRAGLEDLVAAGIVEKRPRVGNFVKPIRDRVLTKTLVLLVPRHMLLDDRLHPTTSQLLRGISTEMPPDDWDVSVMYYEKHRLDEAINRLVGRRVDGVLFWPSPETPADAVQRLLDSPFPTVSIGLHPHPVAHSVSIDVPRLVRDVWQKIEVLGHQQVVAIHYEADRWSALESKFIQAFKSSGEGRHVIDIRVPDTADQDECQRLITDALLSDPRPTAVILWDEFLALELMKACERNDIQIPDDVSVAAIFNQLPHVFSPPLSAPNSCSLVSRMASEACQLLRNELTAASPSPVTLSLVGEFQWSASVRPHHKPAQPHLGLQ